MTDPIAETIARVSRSAVVVCDKCRLHGANNDVTVCRAPGNCHDLADHSRAAALLADECEELRSKLEHTQYWYSVRLEHLHHWAHSKLSAELRTEYFSIVANGHEAGSPPTYAQKMNMLSHARDKAEAECSRLQAEVTQLRAERDMPCAHRLEEERLRERVRVLEGHLRTVIAGDPTHPRFGWEDEGNAPGHSHAKPGVWDWDNGERAHKPCEWCAAWYAARAALEGIEVE